MNSRISFKLLFVALTLIVSTVTLTTSVKANWVPEISDTINGLQGVWGTSDTNVFVVGNLGTIRHYDGNPEASWSQMENNTA